MYVLLVATWFGGYVSGYSVIAQEFTSAGACNVAKDSLQTMTSDASYKLRVTCVPK